MNGLHTRQSTIRYARCGELWPHTVGGILFSRTLTAAVVPSQSSSYTVAKPPLTQLFMLLDDDVVAGDERLVNNGIDGSGEPLQSIQSGRQKMSSRILRAFR